MLKKVSYVCEFCGKELDNKKEMEIHEISCDVKLDREKIEKFHFRDCPCCFNCIHYEEYNDGWFNKKGCAAVEEFKKFNAFHICDFYAEKEGVDEA